MEMTHWGKRRKDLGKEMEENRKNEKEGMEGGEGKGKDSIPAFLFSHFQPSCYHSQTLLDIGSETSTPNLLTLCHYLAPKSELLLIRRTRSSFGLFLSVDSVYKFVTGTSE